MINIDLSGIEKFTVLELVPYSTSNAFNESDMQKWIWANWLKECGVIKVDLISKTTYLNNTLPSLN